MQLLNLATLESFYVGGRLRQVQHEIFGLETQVTGAMYVQRMVPQKRCFPFPIVFLHGGMHSGVTWETTPDGREGWQTLFVRAGFETLVIDQAWRGRSSPDLTGLNPLANGAEAVGPAFTCGLEIGERFARGGGRFPLAKSLCYGAQLWPDFGVPGAIAAGTPGRSDPRALEPLLQLIDLLGEVVLITHSQGGHLGWMATLNRPHQVKAIASIEPAQTCPGLDDPLFPNIPVRLMWGDNLPSQGSTLSLRDVEQARVLSQRFTNISLDYLPESGIHGNGHMLMMEDNNDVLAARVADWLLSTPVN
ncbi:pimeloyl-ACP methyl ester carboxylesterase [Pseudomonas sp. JAI111]|uniref:alpha/beta fold hydrolase n=1 Tax=Pseudomonas sp. JAI111 TaxID=2735913 RepID=UPI0021670080|nr:alpha/beta fold hydrolase [Pseudomonas sp. JAI111]MCS3835654.1 pimeloyl-ACP methyl ester carboxylesterase [Pseudomonas sp. JAI111]